MMLRAVVSAAAWMRGNGTGEGRTFNAVARARFIGCSDCIACPSSWVKTSPVSVQAAPARSRDSVWPLSGRGRTATVAGLSATVAFVAVELAPGEIL